MQVLKLINQHDAPLCHRIGDQISLGGADGEIFALTDYPDRVIKLGVIYDNPFRELEVYQQVQQVLDYVMTTQPVAFVRVYEHGYLGTYSRKMVEWRKDQQDFLLYYYIMEKLNKLTEDEKKVFHTIASHEDRGINKNYHPQKIKEMLSGMSRGLDFEMERVMLFLDLMRETPIIHEDLHSRNIMKDANANFRLVDLDRCSLMVAHNPII
jgi:hypothetical protein